VPGPFHRLESPTQTVADAKRQQTSGETWGKAARHTAQSNLPSVKAYRSNCRKGSEVLSLTPPSRPHLVLERLTKRDGTSEHMAFSKGLTLEAMTVRPSRGLGSTISNPDSLVRQSP
jgi:hypothetical protein